MARLSKKDPGEQLLDVLKEAIKSGVMKDLCLEVTAPISFQAKKVKGGYRTVAVSRGEEFMPSGVRFGKRGDHKIIFEFAPVDPHREYDQFELVDEKVWTAFPDLESLAIRALGYDAVDTDDNKVRFAQIKPKFLIEIRQREEERAEKEKAEAERKQKSHYEDHPLFGTWG